MVSPPPVKPPTVRPMKKPVDIVRKDGTTTIRYGMRKDRDVNYLVVMDFHM